MCACVAASSGSRPHQWPPYLSQLQLLNNRRNHVPLVMQLLDQTASSPHRSTITILIGVRLLVIRLLALLAVQLFAALHARMELFAAMFGPVARTTNALRNSGITLNYGANVILFHVNRAIRRETRRHILHSLHPSQLFLSTVSLRLLSLHGMGGLSLLSPLSHFL